MPKASIPSGDGQASNGNRLVERSRLLALSAEDPFGDLPQIETILDRAHTLVTEPNENGIYSASTLLDAESASGYQNAWLRDNVLVTYSKWLLGESESVRKTLNGLQSFLSSQRHRFLDIASNPDKKNDVSSRPHVRFDGRTLAELPGAWSHAQNDALGAVVWLRFLVANPDNRPPGATGAMFDLTSDEISFYKDVLGYFKAIEYWSDRDSGCWEEDRRVNCSSVGIVAAAMGQVMTVCGLQPTSEWSELREIAQSLKERSLPTLSRLPFESPPDRLADAALLLLLYPYEAVPDIETQNRILELVQARLQGELGIKRYLGGSYYCQDYEELFTPQERSADFSGNMDYRNSLLVPGREAQWCLFDPLLSVIYGRRGLLGIDIVRSKDRQAFYFQRSIAQLDENLQCPELYFWSRKTESKRKHAAGLDTGESSHGSLLYEEGGREDWLRLGANLAPQNSTSAEISIATRVSASPPCSECRSEMYPISLGEKASPRAWMRKRFKAMAVERIRAPTEFTMAAFRGPVLRNRKNSATSTAGTSNAGGPKKATSAPGIASTALQAEIR